MLFFMFGGFVLRLLHPLVGIFGVSIHIYIYNVVGHTFNHISLFILLDLCVSSSRRGPIAVNAMLTRMQKGKPDRTSTALA